jgi:hypothetical protein
MPSITVPYIDGQDYGVGIDTASGEGRNVAAIGEVTEIPGAGGGIADFQMTQVTSVSQMSQALGISASIGGGVGLFSASARFNFAKESLVNDSSVFVLVSVNVTEAFHQIKSPGITDQAAALLANGQNQRFQDEFGDMFVRGLVTGGQFFGVIQVLTHDQDDKSKVSLALSASYAAFHADGSFDQNFHDALSSRRTTVHCHIEGGQMSPEPVQVDEMIDRARNFPGTVAGNARPYAALLDSYSILPLPQPPNYINLQHQKDVLATCASLRDTDLQGLNNVDYILAHPEQFIEPQNFGLPALRQALVADLDSIAAAASNALNDPVHATLPVLTAGAISLPARVPTSAPPAPPAQTPVPMPEWRTDADIVDIGFLEIVVTAVKDDAKPEGSVVRQSPSPGTMILPASTSVEVTLVRNQPPP